jgi:2-polyprenyl-3-methyl-5-hydroxy-6-metoxy-1,4-benzoquinol methylase
MTHPLSPELNTNNLSKIAKRLYTRASFFSKFIQSYRPYICPFDSLINCVKGETMLDIGCGGGLFLNLLAYFNKIKIGVGYDISQKQIDLAKQTFNSQKIIGGVDLQFIVQSKHDEIPESLYDVVSLIDVIHHIPSDKQIIFLSNAISRVKPGGIFIYKDMSTKPMFYALINRIHDLILAKQWIHYLSLEKVLEVFNKEGFSLIQSEDILKGCYHHNLLVFKKN